MLLKQAIEKWSAFRFMIEQLELHAGNSRKELYGQAFSCDTAELTQAYEAIAYWQGLLNDSENATNCKMLSSLLSSIMDIGGTVKHLSQKMLLDDVELFEIKQFGLITLHINSILEKIGYAMLPNLSGAVALLDPENQRLSTFYIYDCYNKELAEIRSKLRIQTQEPDLELMTRAQEIENQVREELSVQLRCYTEEIAKALETVAQIDIEMAKAKLAITYSCCRPEYTDSEISYEGLYNPKLKVALECQNKEIQPIDISLGYTPILLTGINMGGKTVLLKSLALAQLMSQYGFYVPARRALITPVTHILCSMNDDQDELKGLSSFAAEMQNIDLILSTIEKGKRLLILVDELARTTNPTEGRALVSAFLSMVSHSDNFTIVTSHYDGITAPCRRLRVKGLRQEPLASATNIEQWIDYRLVDDNSEHAPQEAIRIAQLLGINPEFIEEAKKAL